MNKKIFFLFFLLFFSFLFFSSNFALAQSQNQKINLYFFEGEGCPHCAKEKIFLEKLEQKYSDLKVYQYEIWNSAENRKLLMEIGKKLNINISGVPFTVINEKYFAGWFDEKTTGSEIEEAIKCAREKGCHDLVNEILLTENNKIKEKCECENKKECKCENKKECGCEKKTNSVSKTVKIPIVGEIETKNFSLPILTIIFGALDGFNPCAMWVLVLLISLLLGMKNRKKMWILGSTFIITSALVYFLFMTAWLNLILFLGFVFWVRIIIGLIALAGGIYFFKEFLINKTGGCDITGIEKKQKIFEKMKSIIHQTSFWLALGGIILLAFGVNLVELLCSAGLPTVYTQILTLNDLAKWQYYFYILFYIFIFMLDDLLVFFIAMITLKTTGFTSKYTRFSHLIGAILMLIIGLLLIFKYQWLMFG